MNEQLKTYLTWLPQFLVLLPAAVLCYLPMKNRLRFSPPKTAALCLLVLLPCAALAAWVCLGWSLDPNLLLLPSLPVFFLCYLRSVRVESPCALAMFMGSCTLMTFPAQFGYGFDAWLHPDSGAAWYSMQAAVFQLGLCLLLVAALAYPCWKRFAGLVDRLADSPVWYLFLTVHTILFVFNLLMIPHSYATLYAGRVFFLFVTLEGVLLALFLFLHVIFCRLAEVLLRHAELVQRAHFLEMQAEQYRTLQNHIVQTRQLRHDFRQSVHILAALAEAGDLPGLKTHLREYEHRLDADAPARYCASAALNALFNYYKAMADAQGIRTLWQIDLPAPLSIPELDMASLLGNLMENAIAGCATAPEGQRRFALSVEARQGNCLYIVSTNSFDGRPRKSGGDYLSTKHAGEGLGLLSIASVAEKHHGQARFSHEGTEFFVDVMLKF